MRAIRRVPLLIALAVAVAATGCRRPDPVYDRFPRPIGMRDVVRAERRTEALSEPERLAVEIALDRHQVAFEQVRAARIVPFVESIRGVSHDDAFADPASLRKDLERHASIMADLAALDRELFDELERMLGGAGAPLVRAARSRRSLDNANTLGVGDGGRSLPDLLTIVERLSFPSDVDELIRPLLAEHAVEAGAVADRVAREQLHLTRKYLELAERLGPPDSAPDVVNAADAREDAINRELINRYARSRESLERALAEYADLTDRTVLALRPHMPVDAWERLDRGILRLRIDDDIGRSADALAFQALVASRSVDLPRQTRDRIAALRERFLAEDTELLRKSFTVLREGKSPGELVPGGQSAAQARKDSRSKVEAERALLAKRTTEELHRLLPPEVRDRIGELRETTRDEFRARIVELVGSGRAPSVLAQRPDGFGERRGGGNRQPSRVPDRHRDGGALRAIVAPAPHADDVKRLLVRAGADEAAQAVAFDLYAALSERWRASTESAEARSSAQIGAVMTALERGTPAEFRREVNLFLSIADDARRERQGFEEQFAEDLSMAVADLRPVALELWNWERRDLRWRIEVGDLPASELLTIAPESAVQLFDVLVEADLPDDVWPCIAEVMQGHEEEFVQAGERMRSDLLGAVRGILEVMMEARQRGADERQALRENRTEMLRAAAPVESSARRVAELNAEALVRICACLDDTDASRLRLTYARAAYPRMIDDGRSASDALRNAREDPALDDGRAALVDQIMRRRDAARDAAITELLEWGRGGGISRTNMRRRSELHLRFPPVAKAVFLLEEADARALRAAGGLLNEGEATRHRDVARWFDDDLGAVRGYD